MTVNVALIVVASLTSLFCTRQKKEGNKLYRNSCYAPKLRNIKSQRQSPPFLVSQHTMFLKKIKYWFRWNLCKYSICNICHFDPSCCLSLLRLLAACCLLACCLLLIACCWFFCGASCRTFSSFNILSTKILLSQISSQNWSSGAMSNAGTMYTRNNLQFHKCALPPKNHLKSPK